MSIASRRAGFDFDQALAPHLHRRSIAQRLMKAPLVVKVDPFTDSGSCLAPVAVALEIDVLMLERAPQPLDEDVVSCVRNPTGGFLFPDARYLVAWLRFLTMSSAAPGLMI